MRAPGHRDASAAIPGRTTRVAHCLEARGKMLEGVAFLESMSDTWESCNSFMYTHNWWHLALFLIDLDRADEALALFDKRVWGVWKEFCEDQINAISLLARLELRGVDVGDRWADVAHLSEAAPARALRRPSSTCSISMAWRAPASRAPSPRCWRAWKTAPSTPSRSSARPGPTAPCRPRTASPPMPRATTPRPRACWARPCRICSRSAAASPSARCSAPSISMR